MPHDYGKNESWFVNLMSTRTNYKWTTDAWSGHHIFGLPWVWWLITGIFPEAMNTDFIQEILATGEGGS